MIQIAGLICICIASLLISAGDGLVSGILINCIGLVFRNSGVFLVVYCGSRGFAITLIT